MMFREQSRISVMIVVSTPTVANSSEIAGASCPIGAMMTTRWFLEIGSGTILSVFLSMRPHHLLMAAAELRNPGQNSMEIRQRLADAEAFAGFHLELPDRSFVIAAP